MNQPSDPIPVLTDIVEEAGQLAPTAGPDRALAFLDQLEMHVTAAVQEHADQLVHNACREMEALLLEQVSDRLKAELPRLVSRVINEHFRGPGRAN
jgi:hypothetical protein